MFKIVKKAIDRFNPYGLLPDAPDDEFDEDFDLEDCMVSAEKGDLFFILRGSR